MPKTPTIVTTEIVALPAAVSAKASLAGAGGPIGTPVLLLVGPGGAVDDSVDEESDPVDDEPA